VKLTEIDRKLAERRAQEPAKELRQGASPAAAHPAERTQAALAAVAGQNPALAMAAATFMGTSLPKAVPGAQAAVSPAGTEPFAVKPEATQYPDKCSTVVCKGSHNPAFYISWRSQKEIVSDLSKRSALFILGGPALTVACATYLLYYFKVL
jgi:hypothetical protein